MKLNKYIDHTLLKQGASLKDLEQLCIEAKLYNFAAVCVVPNQVANAVKLLTGTSVKVCTVIGFPFGYSTKETKAFEIQDAIKNGAQEIDIVQNISYVKEGKYSKLMDEMKFLFESFDSRVITKIILESGSLSLNELYGCCAIYSKFPKINFLKTSTGFAAEGASVNAVKIMKQNSPFEVKASGGIRDLKFAEELIAAGATRIGCSSSVKIMEESLIKI